MLSRIKKKLYFLVASYLRFWAKLVLKRWQPRIIVITGSTGKTTLLHLVESQLGEAAVYSHHANSAFGIPFYILGMEPNVSFKYQWLTRLVMAPFYIFRKLPKQELFVVEADCDRPHEGAFLAAFLKPEVTLWVSVYRTHSMNFDRLVREGTFKIHEEAIAYEFGHFAAQTQKLVLANGDQPVLMQQLERVKADTEIKSLSLAAVQDFQIEDDRTVFNLKDSTVSLPGLHPKELGVSLQMVKELTEYLGKELDPNYVHLMMPPGRSSIFKGKKGITIVDSTYNTGLGAMKAILALFEKIPAKNKWLVLGDILEQGSLEDQEHEGLAKAIAAMDVERVVLLGPRTKKHTAPLLAKLKPTLSFDTFERPDEVLAYLEQNLQGGEVVLFKGGRFLEGVIEQLLADPTHANQLVRREAAWVKRRRQWGLPR